jgi:hypothetical protein
MDGRFQADLYRILPTANVIDTVSVVVFSTATSVRFKRPDGSSPVDSVPLMIQLVSTGSPVNPVYFNLRVPVP